MEYAIYFSKIDKLKACDLDKYERVYFGNEFCDQLIPSIAKFEDALSFVKKMEKRISFVTCYVSEHNIKKYHPLIELLAKNAPDSEVIINDLGLLRICLQNNLTPVLGRLLVKQKRDPRIAKFIGSLSPREKLHMQQAGLNKYFIDFLKRKNINRIELDNLLQNIDINELQDSGFSFALYVPYGYITTTRLCLFRNKNKEDSGRLDLMPCNRECARGPVKLHNKRLKEILFMKGNTIFFKNTSEDLLRHNSKIDRVIHQPEIPD